MITLVILEAQARLKAFLCDVCTIFILLKLNCVAGTNFSFDDILIILVVSFTRLFEFLAFGFLYTSAVSNVQKRSFIQQVAVNSAFFSSKTAHSAIRCRIKPS